MIHQAELWVLKNGVIYFGLCSLLQDMVASNIKVKALKEYAFVSVLVIEKYLNLFNSPEIRIDILIFIEIKLSHSR